MNDAKPIDKTKTAPPAGAGKSAKKRSRRRRYSTFWPIIVIAGSVIFSNIRDIITLQQQTAQIVSQNRQADEPLRRAGEENTFVESLKSDLQTLAVSDPLVAQVLSDFFPSGTPSPKSDTAPATTPHPGSGNPKP